jgi:hypothetical protein
MDSVKTHDLLKTAGEEIHRLRTANAALVAVLEGAIVVMERVIDVSEEGWLLTDEYDACCAALRQAKGE